MLLTLSVMGAKGQVGAARSVEARAVLYSRAAYALALTLLLANDHWLKHAALAPGWFTGKLSDFTGLIVAPVSLGLLVGVRSRGGRLACFACVALPFAAVKISPACAALLERALTALSWRVVPDPTDLLALVVAPAAIAIARWLRPQTAGETSFSGWRARSGAVLGALACAASGPQGRLVGGPPFLINKTSSAVVVELAFARSALAPGDASGLDYQRTASYPDGEGGVDCAALLKLEDGSLRGDDFGSVISYRVEAGGALPLGSCFSRVAVGKLTRAVVADPSAPERTVSPVPPASELADSNLLIFLERAGGNLALRAGSGTRLMKLLPANAPVPANDCDQNRGPHIGASAFGSLSTTPQTIVEKVPVGEGCVAFVLAPPGSNGPACTSASNESDASVPGASDEADAGIDPVADQHCILREQASVELCVPDEVVPFSVGDAVTVTRQADGLSLIGRAARVLVRSGAIPPRWSVGTSGAPAMCAPVRDPCGALYSSLDLALEGTPIPLFEPIEISGVTYYVDRAVQTVLAYPACPSGLNRTGTFMSWVEVIHEATP